MKRAQINLWLLGIGGFRNRAPFGPPTRMSMKPSPLPLKWERSGCVPETCAIRRATPHCVAYSIAPKVSRQCPIRFGTRTRSFTSCMLRRFTTATAMGSAIFAALIEKLDYLQELGVTAIWLLPFYPSPLRDDGYDIADYFDVNPSYGTLEDFRAFLDAAHERGLARHHGAGDQSHLRSKSVVPEIAPRCARLARARIVCLERFAGKIQGRADHFQRFRDFELVVGSGGESVLLASLLFASAGFEFR